MILPTGRGVLRKQPKYKQVRSTLPPMTATPPTGYSVTYGAQASTALAAWQLFDQRTENLVSTPWSAGTNVLANCWVEITLPEPTTFYGYRVRARVAASGEMPRSWVIQVAEDDVSPLQDIDTRVDQTFVSAEERVFEFSAPVYAKRLRFQALVLGPTTTNVSMDELDFLQVDVKPSAPYFVGIVRYGASSSALSAYAVTVMYDKVQPNDLAIGFLETSNVKTTSPWVFSQGTPINLVRDLGASASYMNVSAVLVPSATTSMSVPDTGNQQIGFSCIIKDVNLTEPFDQIITATRTGLTNTFPEVYVKYPNSLVLYVMSNEYAVGNSPAAGTDNTVLGTNAKFSSLTSIYYGQNNAGNGGGVRVWAGVAAKSGYYAPLSYTCTVGTQTNRAVAVIVVNPRGI